MTPQIQSGVLAYRRPRGQALEILLVKKRSSQNWGIPKGKWEAHLTLRDNAAKEAFEEAGVSGNLGEQTLGSFRAIKRVAEREILIEVWVFLLDVTAVAAQWPEQETRLVRWCAPPEAAQLLREPFLVRCCQDLEAMFPGVNAP